MSAVMLNSTREGESSWTFVGRFRKLLIRGATGRDFLMIEFLPRAIAPIGLMGSPSKEFPIPEGVAAVRVKHSAASGQPVSVDLVSWDSSS